MSDAGDDLTLLPYGIMQPVVCVKCEEDVASGRAEGLSLREYTALDVGFTGRGFQVWCRRHDQNVVHIDFDGARPGADFRCFEPKPDSLH